ncbi:MAG: glycosyltransferase family 2 protein [Rickettsiales bacterium]
MSDRLDISVIIACYKVPGYITRAVESVLAQKGVTFEIVLVDDCSPDNTWEVIETITNPRLHAMRMEQNSGPSVARNRAIAAARGEWLAVLDGDDIMFPGRLKRMLELGRAKQADIVVDNQLVMKEVDGGTSLMFPDLAALTEMSAADFIKGNDDYIGPVWGYGYMKPLFRADFLREHGLAYRETISIGEDFILMLEALASGARCVVDVEAGYGYTVRADSISSKLTPEAVARIQKEDAWFFDKYKLDSKSLAAQRVRARNLVEAYQFNRLVGAIKGRNVVEALKVSVTSPRVLRHLMVPVGMRVARAYRFLF